MGLVGILSGVKKFIPSFLHIGAVLMIMGGLFACCYNCDFYNKFDNRRSWKSYEQTIGESALASGIIGVIAAVAALVAVVLSFTGLSGMIVNIVYAVTCVLYIAEVIPEGIIVKKAAWKVLSSRVPYAYGLDLVEDSDFTWWFSEAGKEEANKYEPKPEQAEAAIVYSFIAGTPGMKSEAIRVPDGVPVYGGRSWAVEGPCIVDWSGLKYKDSYSKDDKGEETWKDCDKIEIKTVKCVPTWSESALTAVLRDYCEGQIEAKKQTEKMEKKTEERNKLIEAVEKDLQDNAKTLEDLMQKKDATIEIMKWVADRDSMKKLVEFDDDQSKEKYDEEKAELKTNLGVLSAMNEAMIAIQTVGFIFTLVGVVLSFAMSALPGGDDAAKADA